MSEEIKVIKVELPDYENIEIYPISDLHWGEKECDEKLFLKFLDYILEKENRYVVLNGDLLNMALTMSVSDTYAEKYSPDDAIDSLANVLQRIKGRILAMGTGNHEDRVYRYTGIDASAYLAMKIGLPQERYSDNSFVLFVSFGRSQHYRDNRKKKNVYSGFFHHGVGGGKKKGGKMNMVVGMRDIVDTDFYVVGHVHDPMMTPTRMLSVDHQNKTIRSRTQYYMISNAWLKYGGYGQKFGFSPSAMDINYLTLNGRGEKRIKMHIGV